MRRSWQVAVAAIFAAVHATLYLPPGPWRSWAVYLEPIEGILLGPTAGFCAAFLGSSVARLIKPSPDWMFGVVAEPVGVLVCGLLALGKWKPVVAVYAVTLVAYFAHPFGRLLPLWTILDVLFAFFLIYPVAKIGRRVLEDDVKRSSRALVFIAFVGVATDSLMRVFLLVPAQLYTILVPSFDVLFSVFVFGAIGSYIENLIVVIISVAVGLPLLMALKKLPTFTFPLTKRPSSTPARKSDGEETTVKNR
jgi:hypothetical protein